MTMALQTAPNSAVPVGLRKKIAADVGLDAPKHAAGIVFVAPDGDILLLRRSSKEANFSGHWALPGGGVDAGETPAQGAQREAKEEMGIDASAVKMKPLDRRITPTGTAFHTFASPVGEKFVPKLNDEHSGYAWAPLDQLPGPLHPAVAQTLQEQVGVAEDMKPEDWKGLRDGFLKWTGEEEKEPEHAADAALILALDEGSVRTYDKKDHLHVSLAHISKATVSPYRGKEIPNSEALGLEPDRIYQLLRDPAELEKAAPSFNAIQILIKHTPVNAADHKPHETVGATGTDCKFEEPYLNNSLVIWAKDAIDAIESGDKKELSCGYNYRADMTPGIFNGMRYDGVMRDIVGNHVALVKDGRAGPDVVVGDSMENLMTKPTRLAALTLGLTAAAISPLLAMDAAITLPKSLFDSITSKNITAKKAELLAGVRAAADGKLRKGMALDASMEHVGKVMDTVAGLFGEKEGVDESVSEEQHKAMEAAAHGESNLGIPKKVGEEFADADKGKAFDAEPLKNFLREKGMGEDDIMKACDMMPKSMAGDESEEEKKKKEEAEKKKAAEDKAAKDAEMKDMVTKPAMDAALKATEDAVTKRVRAEERDLRMALDEVRPYVGELAGTLALDSAEAVRRHALEVLRVPGAKEIHASALSTILAMQPKAGARPVQTNVPMAMDAATAKSFADRFPGADRIGAA